MIYIPKGFAHGFQTLEDDTEILYFMSDYHAPEQARGFRWNESRVAIDWPAPAATMSPRDRSYDDLSLDELEPFRADEQAAR